MSTVPLDGVLAPSPALVLESPATHVEVKIHDASRLEWRVAVPLPTVGRFEYDLEVELEVPENVAAITDPWRSLESYARLDGSTEDDANLTSVEAFRRAVAATSSRLARTRDGF